MGLCFLWESKFYMEVGRWLLEEAPGEGLSSIFNSRWRLLEWKPSNLSLTEKNQYEAIRLPIFKGTVVREFLKGLIKDEDAGGLVTGNREDPGNLDKIGRWLRDLLEKAPTLREELGTAFRKPEAAEGKSTAKNTYETVLYSLLSRDEIGRSADFYGVLVTRSRRFRVVEPGKEWIVVLASLQAGGPREQTLLSDLRASLSELCIGVSRDTLILELERAGLSRSAHDADDAIIVNSGF